jgi:dihydroorotase
MKGFDFMKRLLFAVMTFLIFICMVSPVFAQRDAAPDILLKGGHVIDVANNINRPMDILVKNGKIARVARNIPASEAEKVVDLSGHYITPGIIDIHVHVDPAYGLGLIADHHHFPFGVTTCVDAGTSGAKTFDKFKELIDKSRMRVLAFINVSSAGMNENEGDPHRFNVNLMVETAKKYPDVVVGFKSAHYHGGEYKGLDKPWASVDSTIAAGNLANLPCMFDVHMRKPEFGQPERSYRGLILDKMRPGDIHTHNYAAHFPVIMDNGKVNPDIIKAQKSGRIFDVGHGGGSIVFRNAVPAIKQGYLPDAISTDLHSGSVNGPALGMINVMSKFLNIGLTLEQVIEKSTYAPAQIIRRPELGNLSVGSTADIAVIKLINGKFTYLDTSGGKIDGDKKLECVMTLFGGRVVFDPGGLSYPYWENIPKDDRYWINYTGQYW